MKRGSYRRMTFVVWVLSSALLLRRFRGIFDLEPEDQKVMYYSESAFYLSFYHDIVEAPNWSSVWSTLSKDDRTEFPEVVVAFKRLNIMQEVTLGVIYRLFNLGAYMPNPFSFYAYAVLLLNAAGIALLFQLACECGKSVWAGHLFFGLYLSNFREKLISRIAALPLRENFALPALWVSLLCLRHILRRKRESGCRCYHTLFAAYMWMFLTWQLSLHVVGTQVGCLFLLNLFGAVPDDELRRIITIVFGSLFASWLLMFCPAIMLSSHLVTGTIAVLASTLVVPSNESDSGRRRAGRALQRLLLALAIFCLEDLILSLTTRHDGHIVQILLSTLKLSNPTFDSQIYMLGSEFRPLSIHVIHRILPTRLFQYAAVALLVLSILTYKGDRSTSGFRRSFNRYLGLQILVFVCMALAVSRLRVLALPLLCVFAGYTTLVLRLQPFKQS